MSVMRSGIHFLLLYLLLVRVSILLSINTIDEVYINISVACDYHDGDDDDDGMGRDRGTVLLFILPGRSIILLPAP